MTRSTTWVLDPAVEARMMAVARLKDSDVLLVGERGTGKTRIAEQIHEQSALRDKPFVAQNCAAIPNGLMESVLFGHVKGAFTGADKDMKGIVAAADGGTLFLDEIGELPPFAQAKLLTLLQDRVYRPVGSVNEIRARFRLISATNRDLIDLCHRGLFHDDLYDRVNGLSIELPPLRKSPGRARQIAEVELAAHGVVEPLRQEVLAAVDRLSKHPMAWPGNIRELFSFVRRCALGVVEEERRILEEWGRRRTRDATGHLTPITPAVSPTLDDRERYAELIHEVAAHGKRPKAAASRDGARKLAWRLLDVFPEPLSDAEVQAILDVIDRRTLSKNVDMLVSRGLVRKTSGGLVAIWPPATSMLLVRRRGEWGPVGAGEIPALAVGDRVRIEVTAKCAGTLGVMMMTHRPGAPPSSTLLLEGRELRESAPEPIEIELDGEGGLEQILVHVGPPAGRGGKIVEPTTAEGMMPDSQALELGRRMVLGKWQAGWLAEHLVSHSRVGLF